MAACSCNNSTTAKRRVDGRDPGPQSVSMSCTLRAAAAASTCTYELAPPPAFVYARPRSIDDGGPALQTTYCIPRGGGASVVDVARSPRHGRRCSIKQHSIPSRRPPKNCCSASVWPVSCSVPYTCIRRPSSRATVC